MTSETICCHGGKIRNVTFSASVFSEDSWISITSNYDRREIHGCGMSQTHKSAQTHIYECLITVQTML